METFQDLKETKVELKPNGILLVTLYRPQQLNAWTFVMKEELIKIFKFADRTPEVRGVVVTGSGDRAFCAGADLSLRGGNTFSYENFTIDNTRDSAGEVVLEIRRCRKPTIAAISGHAIGVGITFTLGMDIRVVAEDAKIGFVFARRGIVAEGCSSYYLPRLVGLAKASELLLTGSTYTAKELQNINLFNHVVPKDQVLKKALELAEEISLNCSPTSVALNKALLNEGISMNHPHQAHLNESRSVLFTGRTKDANEGVLAFKEKRKPKFANFDPSAITLPITLYDINTNPIARL